MTMRRVETIHTKTGAQKATDMVVCCTFCAQEFYDFKSQMSNLCVPKNMKHKERWGLRVL